MTEQIDSGTPVMVWTDIAELPYLRTHLSMSRHDVVIVGYDDDKELAFVVDNDRDTPQAVPYENLWKARASTGFPVPTRHTTYVVEWPGAAPDLGNAARSAFRRSADAMQGSFVSAPITEGSDCEIQVRGLSGVSTFVEDLKRWPEIFDDDTLDGALFALSAFIEKAGTGGGLFRDLQARGCRRIAEELSFEPAFRAAEAAKTASESWTAVAHTAYERGADPRRRASGAASLAAQLPRAERRLAQALREAGSLLL